MTPALERAELYFMAHPGTPSAVRRPKLAVRSGQWIAWLGRNVRDGIAGFGPTVEAALRAFDAEYIAALRAPSGPATPALRAPIQAGFRSAA
ncbi:MAG: hypothetical protein ACJ8M4_09430 [Chthoniobacterales bacterium]